MDEKTLQKTVRLHYEEENCNWSKNYTCTITINKNNRGYETFVKINEESNSSLYGIEFDSFTTASSYNEAAENLWNKRLHKLKNGEGSAFSMTKPRFIVVSNKSSMFIIEV